ncbi:MAG: NAD-glutamate dehydrogenase [Alphaproteobacteria bacterium]
MLFSAAGEETLRGRDPIALAAAAAHSFRCLRRRAGGEVIEVFQAPSSDALAAARPFLLAIHDDKPFLVDSTLAALNRLRVEARLIFHPVVSVVRNKEGELTHFAQSSARGQKNESVILIELALSATTRMGEIHKEMRATYADLALAVEDWREMRDYSLALAKRLTQEAAATHNEKRAEEAEFLRWLAGDHFTFLGALVGDGLVPDEKRALGIFRRKDNLPQTQNEPLGRLAIWKSRMRSRIHLDAPMDLVVVRLPGVGDEKPLFAMFVGLFTSNVHFIDIGEIPILRRKLGEVVERVGLLESSHSGKALRHVLNTWPRDELFHLPVSHTAELAAAIESLQEQPATQIFLHHEESEQLWYVTLCLPRLNVSEATLEDVRHRVSQAIGAEPHALRAVHDESPLVRVHGLFIGERRQVSIQKLAREIDESLRSWREHLAIRLIESVGEEHAGALLRRWGRSISEDYTDRYAPIQAAADLVWLDRIAEESGKGAARLDWFAQHVSGHATPGERACEKAADGARLAFRFLLPGEQVSLSDTLPVLERMGFRVRNEQTFLFRTTGGYEIWLYDFSLLLPPSLLPEAKTRAALAECFVGVLAGRIEDDRLNGLVLHAGLSSQETAILRAVARYLLQTRFPATLNSLAKALMDAPHVARLLVALFVLRLRPDKDHSKQNARQSRPRRSGLERQIEKALESVADAAQDRILRALFEIVCAIVRSNYWQVGAERYNGAVIAFKLEPRRLEFLPRPRPLAEIFISAPDFDGVHLRFGRIARGGIRWSDRPDDFRDEILGLAKAQAVKNAVIVPAGAKGGFALRRPPTDRGELGVAGENAYRRFITALLEVTDNRDAEGAVQRPPGVKCLDDPDPYLVVAADKGTANFSDIANSIAEAHDFWLRDAFASGGSAGYNHKVMGITARGAWESVRRHFRELGRDAESTPLIAIGVGDMSGDVFGNGMLLSRKLQLVAAFNHRWIFLDPNPDPALQGDERRRLFESGLDWNHFDEAKISPGGGVFDRSAKRLQLSEQAAQRLGVPGVEAGEIAPMSLLRAILCAQADLLWFGGIGTYIRASHENDATLADRANDAIRVSGREVRARVIAEGANLGVTQAGRIEYASHGGHINTDFIDNSGGVDCSDHEVNIKILLAEVESHGTLSRVARDRLLESMELDVAAHVLRHNFLQVQSLSVMEGLSVALNDRLRHVIRHLERHHDLDRRLSGLPEAEEFEDRNRRGLGLTRPELSVLLAHTKNALYDDLIGTALLADPFLEAELLAYFPKELAKRYPEEILQHPLRSEIMAMLLANGVGNRMGVAFVSEVGERTGSGSEAVVRAWITTLALFSIPRLWHLAEAMDFDPRRPDEAVLIEAARLCELVTAWLLRNRGAGSISSQVVAYREDVEALRELGPGLLLGDGQLRLASRVERFVALGLPSGLAEEIAFLPFLSSACGISDLAQRFAIPVEQVAGLFFSIGEYFGHDWMRSAASTVPRTTLWDKLAVQSLLEDADLHQAALTARILSQVSRRNVSPLDAIAQWVNRHQGEYDRASELLAELRVDASPRLSMLLLANRHLKLLSGLSAG